MRRFLEAGCLAAFACLAHAYALPVVSAGDDQLGIPLSTAAGGNIYLMGGVTDDGQPRDSVVWSSLTTLAEVTFGDRLSAISRATLLDTGTYFLELRAYYGAQSYADTIRITVRPNLPFIVLAPREMEQVQIGKPFVIKWQMDPSKKCTVELSVDGGLSYTWLNPAAAVKDSLVWHVDSAIADSTIAMLKVHEYEVFDPFAARTLVLVNHAPEPYQSVRPQRNGFSGLVGGVSSDRSGTIRVSNVGSGVISVFDARGRVVLHAPVRNGIALGNVMERGALVYRLFTDGNVVRSRIVPGCE